MIYLGSTSVYRRELLERLQLPFECVRPTADEEDLKAKFTGPANELALHLAEQKLKSILSQSHKDGTPKFSTEDIVIASDQTLIFKNTIYGKPGTHENAIQRLTELSGQWHELNSAMVVAQGDKIVHVSDYIQLKMKVLTPSQIETYLIKDQPYNTAGAYKIETLGISLFTDIVCKDFTSIVGLPLIQLSKILQDFGHSPL